MHSYHDDFGVFQGPYTVSFPYEAGTTSSGHNPSPTFVNLTHVVSPSTFWDACVSGYYLTSEQVPNSGYTMSPHYDIATGVQTGGSVGYGSGTESRTVVHGKLSHYATDFLGADHDFKFGAQFVSAGTEAFVGIPGGAVYYDYDGEPYLAYFREPYPYGGASRNAGGYAEDTLTFGGRLTLNLGLRFDHSTAISPDVETLDAAGEKTGETVSGLGTLYSWSAVSPRLGFNLKLTADGRTLLHGNWGRFHQGIFASEPTAVHPGITPSIGAYFDPATGGYTVFSVWDPKAALRIDTETGPPYTDQFSIGLDRELFANTSVSATYVHKEGREYVGWDALGVYEPGIATFPDGRTVPTYSLTTPTEGSQFLLTNQDELFLRYGGLLVTFEKRWADRFQALASYSISEAVGLQATNGREPGFGQLSTTLGWIGFGRDPNDYTNATGPLNNDRTHMFRVQGAVEIPKVGILVGANFQHLTGQPFAAYGNVRLPQGTLRIFIEPRGARRLSSQTLLDLRISKIFRFGKDGKVELLADILNLLNDTAETSLVTNNFYSDNFEKPSSFVDPLRAMIGVKLAF